MLYLLLKKDYEVMRLARKKVINKDELWDAADTIEWVLQAVDFRYKDLQGKVEVLPNTAGRSHTTSRYLQTTKARSSAAVQRAGKWLGERIGSYCFRILLIFC